MALALAELVLTLVVGVPTTYFEELVVELVVVVVLPTPAEKEEERHLKLVVPLT